MPSTQTLQLIGAYSALISAAFWILTGCVVTVYPIAYLSGPRNNLVWRIRIQSASNGLAAIFSGIAAFCAYWTMTPNQDADSLTRSHSLIDAS